MSDYITKPLDAALLEMKLVKWVLSALSGEWGLANGGGKAVRPVAGEGMNGEGGVAGDLEMQDSVV